MENVNLANLLAKRVTLSFSTLRTRSDDWKAELVNDFKKEVLPFLGYDLKPIVYKTIRKNEINEGHEMMKKNENVGKIVVLWE